MTPDVRAFYDPETSTLSYLVADSASKDAIVIDPILDYDVLASQTSTGAADRLLAEIESRGLHLRAILETHAHADHLSGARYLQQKTSAPVVIGRDIATVQSTFKAVFHLPAETRTDGSQFDRLVEHQRPIRFGTIEVVPLATPGHTPACMSYLVGDAVFTGDALFMEDYGTGRADFPAGSAEDLYHSVKDVLYRLPDDTRVFVGHDYRPEGRELRYESTIGREKEGNIQLRASTTKEAFVAFRKGRDATLPPPRLIFQSIQVNVYGGWLPEAEPGAGRFLKIPINLKQRTNAAGAADDSSNA